MGNDNHKTYRDKWANELAGLLRQNTSLELAMKELRELGANECDTYVAIQYVTDLSCTEAYKTVLFSDTWSDHLAVNMQSQASMNKTLEELAEQSPHDLGGGSSLTIKPMDVRGDSEKSK